MNSPLNSFVDYTFSRTEPLLFRKSTAIASAEAFVDIVREEVAQKAYDEQVLYHQIIVGLEQQLPIIMGRSLQHLRITPLEVWTDILEEIFSSRVLICWRRKVIADRLLIRVAGQEYHLHLDDSGPSSILETLPSSDPPPTLSSSHPWPTEEENNTR